MTLLSSILDKIPDYVPKDSVRFEDEFEIEYVTTQTPKTVYRLEAAPVERLTEVTAITGGREIEYEIGSDVELRDVDGDGRPDSVAFLNTSSMPDEGDDVTILYVADPFIDRYTASFNEEIDAVGTDLNQVLRSKYIDTAEEGELDLIGDAYGPIGRRRYRNDEEYTEYLKSLSRAFSARGTKEDIKFVAASIFRSDEDGVDIIENYDRAAFDLNIEDPRLKLDLRSATEVIELAAPTGVNLLTPISVISKHDVEITSGTLSETSEHSVELEGSTTTTSTSTGLGSGVLNDGTIE